MITLRYVIFSEKKGVLFDYSDEMVPVWEREQKEMDNNQKKVFSCMTLPKDRSEHELRILQVKGWKDVHGDLTMREVHPSLPSINGKTPNVRASWKDLANALLVSE